MLLICFVAMALQFKILFLTYVIAPTFQVSKIPFSMRLHVLADELLTETKLKLSKLISDCNGTRTHNHLVCKRTLNHLPKLTNG